jgi:serine/threonine protein kinase
MENTFLYPQQRLTLPDLADKLRLNSPNFYVEKIFQGGMGTCAKIISTNNQPFALKIIHSSLLANENASQRYIEEMKTWLTLSACNGVVEAICLTKVNEIPCVAAQWMAAGSLRPFIKNVNPEFFYKNIDRIASTLQWAFSNYSIIHRDLKPENILLDENGSAFVADWGLARPISKPSNEPNFDTAVNKLSNRIDLTEVGTCIGTIVYASPEQILGQQNIDHRSDIYSLGCMMYEWETGVPPFIANSIREIAYLHLNAKPKKIGGFFKSTHYKVERIIDKCLEKKPDKRYQTYEELINELQSIAQKNSNYKKFVVSERYKVPIIGKNEFVNKLESRSIPAHFSQDGKHAIIELDDIMPYLKEADSLISLGEYEKAKNIYQKFFVPDLFLKIPDHEFVQTIAINYSFTLKNLNQIEDAINVITCIDKAENKPATYFINLSLCYLVKKEWGNAEKVCKEGLLKYPNDIDLIGNMTISLSFQNKLQEAVESATKRLKISRDVHSLEEAANVLYQLAETQKNTNFPEAIKNYNMALLLLQEAKELNSKFFTARLSIANILYKLRKYDESSKELAETSKLQQGIPEIGAFYMARNLLWTSNFEAGKQFCEKWLEKFPNSIFLKKVYVEIMIDGYLLNGKPDEIDNFKIDPVNFFNECLRNKETTNPNDYIYLSKIFMWMGGDENINYAMALLEEGLQSYPDNWEFNFWIATYLKHYNQIDNALIESLEAKRKAPWREKNCELLYSIYKTKGDMANSEKYKKEYEKIEAYKEQLYNQK